MVHNVKYTKEDVEDNLKGILSYTSCSPFKKKKKGKR